MIEDCFLIQGDDAVVACQAWASWLVVPRSRTESVEDGLQIPGYGIFKCHKYAHRVKNGERLAITYGKLAQMVANITQRFITRVCHHILCIRFDLR